MKETAQCPECLQEMEWIKETGAYECPIHGIFEMEDEEDPDRYQDDVEVEE